MKITLYMAISIDGFTTRGQNDTSWVSKADWEQCYFYIKGSDAVIMGRETMEQFEEGDFPVKGTFNIVLSRNKELHIETEDICIREGSPQDIVDYAKKKGFENLLIIGGENTNGQFLREGLIKEIVLSVHPLVIGKGLNLFGNKPLDVQLKLLGSKGISNELVQLKYEVLSNKYD